MVPTLGPVFLPRILMGKQNDRRMYCFLMVARIKPRIVLEGLLLQALLRLHIWDVAKISDPTLHYLHQSLYFWRSDGEKLTFAARYVFVHTALSRSFCSCLIWRVVLLPWFSRHYFLSSHRQGSIRKIPRFTFMAKKSQNLNTN